MTEAERATLAALGPDDLLAMQNLRELAEVTGLEAKIAAAEAFVKVKDEEPRNGPEAIKACEEVEERMTEFALRRMTLVIQIGYCAASRHQQERRAAAAGEEPPGGHWSQ